MMIKELVDKIKVSDLAPIYFLNDFSKERFAECRHMADEEQQLGVYLANTDIDEYYDLQSKYNPIHLHQVINDISYLFMVTIRDEKIIYATYVILHEIGHWINFKNSGMSSLEYAKWDATFRSDPHKFSEWVRSIPDNHPEKYRYAEEAVKQYRNIPAEKEADKYAFNNLKEKLNLLGIKTDKTY